MTGRALKRFGVRCTDVQRGSIRLGVKRSRLPRVSSAREGTSNVKLLDFREF